MSDPWATQLTACAFLASTNLPAGARASAFFGSFVPSLLAIVFLSTPRLRKQWAFWILIAALIIAMGKCALEMHMMTTDIYVLNPDQYNSLWAKMFIADYFVQWVVPWICDCALLCKVLAFHPAPITPWKKRASIIAFPLAMHIPRIPMLVASLVLVRVNDGEHGTWTSIQSRLLVAEGALQMAQNCYCSGFLLYKARRFARADYAAFNQQAQRARLGLRFFTESILFTFLPASMLQILWLAVAFVRLSSLDDSQRLPRADFYLRMFNVTFSVNFGLLAVWWASARIHAQGAGQVNSRLRIGAAGEHASAEDMSLLDWAIGPIELEESSLVADGSASVEHRNNFADELESITAEEEEEKKEERENASLRRRRQSTS